MNKKYLNEAIIGNKKIVASFSSKGELLRVFYPTRDYRQFVDEMDIGIKVNDSMLIDLHNDINNTYDQYYTEGTNILNTQIKNTYFNIEIIQTDFAIFNKDVLVKKYKFINNNTIDLNVQFLLYSKLLSSFNNMVGSKIENNVIKQYSHNYTFSIFSKSDILSWCLNGSKEDMQDGILYDKDYIAMANDSAISYEIGNLKPGEEKEFEIYMYICDNRQEDKIKQLDDSIGEIRKINIEKELENTKKYWQQYLSKHDGLNILNKKQEEKWIQILGKEELEKVKKIYERTILLFPLLTNNETGGISAALEVDEQRDKSGRYSYCWPRDAVFITKALDVLKMNKETQMFYTEFSKQTQSKNGMWEQRFFTDGKIAPCWGYQIDETASIVFGTYEHYKETKDKKFLESILEMCEKAVEFLKKYVDYINSIQQNNNEDLEKEEYKKYIFSKYESYDIWEMHEGIHLYSLSAIYAAFESLQKIYDELNTVDKLSQKDKKKIDILEKYKQQTKLYCNINLVNKETKTLKRSNKDEIIDISILGSICPFNMIDTNEIEDKDIIKNTIEKMELTLKTYTGGYLRFEGDNYIGGNNPWIIATLWMAMYHLKEGRKEKALECLKFVTKTATEHGLLAEQIDNKEMKSKWVIGLGWSHAMYIDVLGTLLNEL